MTVTTYNTYKWTIDRYHQAVEGGVFEGEAIELLNGELSEMPPEGVPHAGLSSDGADYLRELLGQRVKIREGKPITLPNDSEPEPDIAIVAPLGEVYRTERHPYVEDVFWLIEYSNTSLDKDLKLKTRIYAGADISEYWVINLKVRELIIFRDPIAGLYQSRRALTSGTISPLSFPEIKISVPRLIR
jgi:Uma2 family endonuclease